MSSMAALQTENGHSKPSILIDTVICTVGGYVWQTITEKDVTWREPVVNAKVAIKDSARSCTTNETGQFTFKNLRPGNYLLQVVAPNGWVGEREIQVPPHHDVEVKPVGASDAVTIDVEAIPPPVASAKAPLEAPVQEQSAKIQKTEPEVVKINRTRKQK